MSRIKFYGVRGSIPICNDDCRQFGGNTTCILFEGRNRTVILDAGTGIRDLGRDLAKDPAVGRERPCFLAFSHFHWDHIQGLPFFAPAYDPGRRFTISAIGRKHMGKNLRRLFEAQMQEEFFPVSLDGMGARFDFMQTAEEVLQEESSSVRVLQHNHPGGAYSYRFQDSEGHIIVYVTDIEHGETIDERIVELARDADLLIHEGQYTSEELPRFKGWGHSSWEQAVEVAQQAGVKRLVITHHDPDHNDHCLEEIERQAQARFPGAILAREKTEIAL